MTTTLINSKQRSSTFRMALGAGAIFLLVTLVLGVLGQWAGAITLVVGTIFFSLLALTGHQLNRALLALDNVSLPERNFREVSEFDKKISKKKEEQYDKRNNARNRWLPAESSDHHRSGKTYDYPQSVP